MRSLLFLCFVFTILCCATIINANEKSITNPKGYSVYSKYADDLVAGKTAIQSKTDNKKTIEDFYESHRTLMLGLLLMKEENGPLNDSCNTWYEINNKSYPNTNTFEEAYNVLYEEMQNFYYDYLEEKLGTPKMGEYAAEYYNKIWDTYLSQFIEYMKKGDFSTAGDSSATPSIISHLSLIGIGLFSVLGYYFTFY